MTEPSNLLFCLVRYQYMIYKYYIIQWYSINSWIKVIHLSFFQYLTSCPWMRDQLFGVRRTAETVLNWLTRNLSLGWLTRKKLKNPEKLGEAILNLHLRKPELLLLDPNLWTTKRWSTHTSNRSNPTVAFSKKFTADLKDQWAAMSSNSAKLFFFGHVPWKCFGPNVRLPWLGNKMTPFCPWPGPGGN